MHAEALDDFRRPTSYSILDKDHRSPSQALRPSPNGLSPTSRPTMQGSHQPDYKSDAIDRIQTQVSLNRASLENSIRDIKTATEHIRRLEDGFNELSRSYTQHFERLQTDLLRQLDVFKHQLAAASGNTGPGGERFDDHTLEMLTRNLSAVSDKANKVDNMELDMQLMKRRMAKLEEQLGSVNLSTGHEQVSQTSAPRQQTSSYPHQQSPQAYGSGTSSMSRQNSDLPHHPIPDTRSTIVDVPGSRWPPMPPQPLKRGTGDVPPDMSPKRTKLAPLEPRLTSHSTNSDDDIHRPRADSGRYSDVGKTMAAFGSMHDSQKELTHHPHTSSRYDSPPSGVLPGRDHLGQTRKHYPIDGMPHSTSASSWPDSGRRDMLVDGQYAARGADGHYYPMAEGSYSSVRRSSIGSGPSLGNSKDPYAHTKKTRTKPVRNSEGILIRKDGKPDMRSQSSAANLRKVHARKEEQRAGEHMWHGSPDSTQHDGPSRAGSNDAADSPSNVMLQHSDSAASSMTYRREDSRPDDPQRSVPKNYFSGAEQRSGNASAETSPRSIHRSSLDTDRPGSAGRISTSTTSFSTAPERRPLSSATLQPESPHSYRQHPPPTLPTPVSMQFKQPEVSMLTKQEVA